MKEENFLHVGKTQVGQGEVLEPQSGVQQQGLRRQSRENSTQKSLLNSTSSQEATCTPLPIAEDGGRVLGGSGMGVRSQGEDQGWQPLRVL